MATDIFEDIKNVKCPYCGYNLSMHYDKNTKVSGLLVFCKGRQCKKSFILNIEDGIQKSDILSNETLRAFQLVYGDDYKEHLLYRFRNNLAMLNYINNNL